MFEGLIGEDEANEDVDIEVKSAQGRDGLGEVPKSLWSTYSAMANTNGGVIILGIDEDKNKNWILLGVTDPDRVRKVFWDNVNNKQIVNVNLLRDSQVQIIDIGEKKVLRIQVPRATRTDRPVYVGHNPLLGTYRRDFEGDYRCDESAVRRMLAEATEEDRDGRVLPNYDFADLNLESLSAFRNNFKSTNPNHPFLALDDKEMLRSLGGWKRDRDTGEEGLTLAGLLMFGVLRSILDVVPGYILDYREQAQRPTNMRWSDRITTDGSWSGNLYDFYRRCFTKLTADLKVPFRLAQAAKRIDESEVHEALREALVNTLIHADFSGTISILVVKRPNLFGFRNPGGLRLPRKIVLAGGTSDCRNRNLQKMFQMVGAAEQAGSGMLKIQTAWREQHWRNLLLREDPKPEQTVLTLPLVSLLPEETLIELDKLFGARFRCLPPTERLALATAHSEGKVTNERLKEICDVHARDLTRVLRNLVDEKYLVTDGVGRGTCYHLPGWSVGDSVQMFLDEPDSVFISRPSTEMSEITSESNEQLVVSRRPMSQHQRFTEAIRVALASGSIGRTEYANLTGVSGVQASRDLKSLVDQGKMKRVGAGQSTRYAVIEQPKDFL